MPYRFASQYGRSYVHDAEEAVRKALLIQHSRFINSGNRQSGTAALAVNAFGDRLDEELQQLLGVDTSGVEETPVGRARRDATDRVPSLLMLYDKRIVLRLTCAVRASRCCNALTEKRLQSHRSADM